jgi:hypothetical protein
MQAVVNPANGSVEGIIDPLVSEKWSYNSRSFEWNCTTQNWNYFCNRKTGIKYLKSPFLSNKKSMTTLIINIKELLQVREIEVAKYLPQLPPKKNLLLLEDNLIADFGSMYSVRKSKQTKLLMPTGMILPSWCDSHTHIVYAGNREQEFVDHKWPQL